MRRPPVLPVPHTNGPALAPDSQGPLPASTWEIGVQFADPYNLQWHRRLIDYARPALERGLAKAPTQQEFTWQTPLGSLHLCLRDGPYRPGLPLRLVLGPGVPSPRTASPDPAPSATPALPSLTLPDDATHQLGERLVGLEPAFESVLRRWACQWDGVLDAWSARTGCPVPPAVRAHFAETPSLLVFHGPPGTGKSAAARVLADRYCRHHHTPGRLVWLTTDTRGGGLVGEFSQRLRAAFQQASTGPSDALQVLLIDEADAVAMHRGEGQAHQEDKAATMTLLQCLDALAGRKRIVVIMTTNRLSALDPAIVRRALPVAFTRPTLAARQALLASWLPGATLTHLRRAAHCAEGMTPADMERALSQMWQEAVTGTLPVTVRRACRQLRLTPRTGDVEGKREP